MLNKSFALAIVSIGFCFLIIATSKPATAENSTNLTRTSGEVDGAAQITSATVQVNAIDWWQSTGVTLQAYSPVTVTVASGLWTHWIGVVPLNPGTGESYICTNYIPANQCNEPMPHIRKGYLIGKVNSQLFAIGSGSVILPSQAGTLYLQINDGPNPGDRADNTGVLTVAINTTSSSPTAATLTSPNDGDTTGPATLQLVASALSGNLAQIEFLAFYDGVWHSAGVDNNAPYQVAWQTPNGLRSQLLRFRIDATLTNGEVQYAAGGERRVNFHESVGDPTLSENWIATRFYLNQRSLDNAFDDGDNKCSAASMAMVLAMNGLVASDYTSMANKANEMYPRVLINGTAYVYKMVAELNRQGAVAVYNDNLQRAITAQEGWQIIKREVDAGKPVIVRTAQGVMTTAGHILVAVGYQEQGTSRRIIAYDPFGQWKGTAAGAYYVNGQEPESRVGQWVYYNFDQIFGQYLITVQSSLMGQEDIATSPNSPPDDISDEPRLTGTYNGVNIIDFAYLIYLPTVRK